jgi:transposase-like protein
MAKAKKVQSVQKTDKKKSDFLIALKNNNGNISEACQAINIGRQTYYSWIEKDETFKQDAEDAQESLIDLAESKLVENIKDNDNTSIIFFLKTKGKKRGYIEKQEIEHVKPFEDIDFNGI